MGTFGTCALHLREEEEEEEEEEDDDDDDDEEEKKRLPPLLEDEENVSLADVLCLRDDGLSEQELWAVCVECVCSLQNISLSPLYHALRITPDTLAFNAHGNVCFMEQLNDDPDGCFIPPEFDKTENTFEGHVFSLGSTLSSAVSYISDVDLSSESSCLLKQMQMENPEDRPRLQDLLSQARVVLGNVSPASVCRRLSAIGRRVLSIESLAAFRDGWEKSSHQILEYKSSRSNSVENQSSDRVMIRNFSSDSYDGDELLMKRRALICNGSAWSGGSTESSPDSRSQNSSPVHRRRSGRARRALNRSCSVPDSNNPPAFGSPSYTPISMLVADLSDITEEKKVVSSWNGRSRRVTAKPDVKSSDSEREDSSVPSVDISAADTPRTDESDGVHSGSVEDEDTSAHADLCASAQATCLNVELQNKWISLRDLLSQSCQPFSVNELWALCYTCLTALQTYIDLPDYVCLDSVFVGCEGEMLFLRPKNTASCDVFFLAPEFQEHGVVTEKVCVYGVAAVLWTAAKFHLSPDQKLAMPRKLKRLLLEMAKKTPVERPSIETVKKCCRDYLSRQGTNAEMVWMQTISRFQQVFDGIRDTEESSSPECAENTSHPHTGEDQAGFVSLVSEGRLAPVAGPVPHNYPINITLPEAFRSPATHFSPIVLSRETLADPGSAQIENDPSEQQKERDIDDVVTGGEFLKSDCCSPSSSSKTLLNSPQINVQSHVHTLSCADGICNNFLLQQNPQTGHLTLLPVQITVPITDLDPFSGTQLNKKSSKPAFIKTNDSMKNKRVCDISRDSSVCPERGSLMINKLQSEVQSVSRTLTPQIRSCPQQIMDLIRDEFAFDGHEENEDLAMAKYIFSLKNLQFETFCRAVREMFRDLHWDQQLLCVLHHLCSDDHWSSDDVKCSHSSEGLDMCSSQSSAQPAPEKNLQKIKSKLNIKPTGAADDSVYVCWREDTQKVISEDQRYYSEEVSDGVLTEVQFSKDPAGDVSERVSGSEPRCHSIQLDDAGDSGLTPDCSETDMNDSDSLISDRTLSIYTDPQILSHGPFWALALYGEDCFGQDVMNYAQKLCSHCQSPTLQDKSQELYQQLLIESRNLKKSRNFYNKLIQQDRRNKGSDTKIMMSKLKMQFDELRSKVEFLRSVQKYLQVLRLDQWGLSLSLLPSLASCGSSSLVLQSAEDPAVLSFLCEKRKGKRCPLVTASASGLMSYLYARNAHADGYIQQFFYTYRYFCTSEELLQFLMDKYNSTLGAKEDLSSDCVKVQQRTLDLMQLWIRDAHALDFISSSALLHTLHSFLSSQVAPVDTRGESLLSVLQATPRKRLSCTGEASISSPEYEDASSTPSLCIKSSIEDAAQKKFQRRVLESQTAQCKEKTFSIAAALPRPCQSFFMRSDEKLTFSQTEHTALHTAQQLTLLEQELFQDCHPVHFLNSRAHGVTEKSANISTCVSVESSSLFVKSESLQDGPLQTLITHSHNVSNWISAELVICDSVKAQSALLTRFLTIGKFCYEMRNFATAMQILSGLENVIVRQLPAWKLLSQKVYEMVQELRAVQVFLKSDSLCLMEGYQTRARAALPAPHILSMHIQQLEIGALTTTSGSYKWTKLRNIARVVSQVHAFQERPYSYPPDLQLQSYLRGRMARLAKCDVSLLASDNDANFNQTANDRHGRRIQDTLRRVKASFQ